MVDAIQAVPAIGAASSLPAVARISQLNQGTSSPLAVPSVILTLGATSAAPLTYNAAGLLDSLLQVSGTFQDTTSAPAATDNGDAVTVADLATLLGLNTTATSSGVLNASIRLQNLPATTAPALKALLAEGFSPSAAGETTPVTAGQALTSLLTTALTTAATGLDSTTSDASVFSATGILQSLPPDRTVTALNSLLSTGNLGLAATALDINSASGSQLDSTGPLLGVPSDATGQNLLNVLATEISLATAPLDTSGSNPTPSTSALNDLLLANANLTVAETGAAIGSTPATTPATLTIAVPAVVATPLATPLTAALATPPATLLAAVPAPAVTPATATAAAAPLVVTATTSVPATTTETTTTPANNVTQNFLVDAVALAVNNIIGNPAYAASAAGLYLNAMVFRSLQSAPTSSPATAYASKPVVAVRAVRSI